MLRIEIVPRTEKLCYHVVVLLADKLKFPKRFGGCDDTGFKSFVGSDALEVPLVLVVGRLIHSTSDTVRAKTCKTITTGQPDAMIKDNLMFKHPVLWISWKLFHRIF